MKAKWGPKARNSFRQIAKYIQRRFGSTARRNFIEEVKEAENLLKRNPYVGKIDPLFADRPRTYRSVVINGLSKMIYFIEDDLIYIAAFWDTRREPKKQAEQVK